MEASTLIHRVLSIVAVAAVAAGAAACGSQGADKSGASAEPQVTLTLETPDHSDKLGTTFAAAVAERSGGSVRVELGRGYDSELPANELRLARALEAGRAEIGYLPARAWSAAGIPAFRALLAPFAVTTDETAQALATGEIARDVLATLPDGVVGLALVPAESRRVLAVRPPLSPADFRGLRLRVVDDPQSAAILEALGAHPVQGLRARDVTTALRDHRLDGAESAPTYILTNGYWNHARHLSGYGLFPNFQSIVLSGAAWQRLSAPQQAAVREAAEDTVRSARAVVAAREGSDLRQLCAAGTRIAIPTARQLQELAEAAKPAVAALANDGAAAQVLDAIRGLPGAGPQPLAAPLPTGCKTRDEADRPESRTAPATIPNGVYVVKVSAAQFRAARAVGPQYENGWTVTTRFRDGRLTQTQTPTYPDQCPDVPTPSDPACSGTYQIDGDEVTFVWSDTPPPVLAPETVKWSYFDGVLRFEPVDVADPASVAIYGQPWRKVR